MLFSEASELYLKESEVRHSKATARQAKGYLRRANEFLGNIECSNFNRGTLLDFIINRRDINPDVSNSTLNKYLLYIKAVLKNEADVIINFKKLREEKKLPQVLSEFTIRKVYKYFDNLDSDEGRRNKLMFMMLLDTGLRISELLSLKVSDFDYSLQMIHVSKTKTKVHRNVLFTTETLELLNNHIKTNNIKSYVFINLVTKKPLHVDSVETICQRIKEKANLKQSITPHKWRHTFATNFNNNNGNTFVLQKLLGHSKITSTQRYVTVSMKKVIEEYSRVVDNNN